MEEKYALIIIGIVAVVGIIGMNTNITGKFTEKIYENYCNPAACKASCGNPCVEYTSDAPFKTSDGKECISSYSIENNKKKFRAWSCD